MHMADALVSPVVGGVMWASTAGLVAYCSTRAKGEVDERQAPLMGVVGAFVFASQMLNFSIPGTGSSGHLGGGLLLAILLGPHAAFMTMVSVLVVQALLFADGGLLALGCNVINLGFMPCFVAYPLVYKRLVGEHPGRNRLMAGSIAAAVVGLQLGSLGVVLETVLSGRTELPFATFAALMQPIHLAIGVVEGLATAAVVIFLAQTRPELVRVAGDSGPRSGPRLGVVLSAMLLATLILGGVLSWFASSAPDGLEWAISRTSGLAELEGPSGGIHETLTGWQTATALLPNYSVPETHQESVASSGGGWPEVDPGTSLSGIVGALLTLACALLLGLLLSRRKRRETPQRTS